MSGKMQRSTHGRLVSAVQSPPPRTKGAQPACERVHLTNDPTRLYSVRYTGRVGVCIRASVRRVRSVIYSELSGACRNTRCTSFINESSSRRGARYTSHYRAMACAPRRRR